MAKGVKTGGRDWAPGQSGNPAGREKLPEDVKAARSLNRHEFIRLATEYLYRSKSELDAMCADPTTPTIELMVASVIKKAVASGDYQRLGFLMSYVVGPAPKNPDDDGDQSDRMAGSFSPEQVLELMRRAREEKK